MKTLEQDELYQHLQGFLKTKGVELKGGSYAQKIQKSCGLLSDAINTSQEGLARAKEEIDKKLDQLRQVIHEKTAPARPAPSPPPQPTPASQAAAKPRPAKKKSAAPKRDRAQRKP